MYSYIYQEPIPKNIHLYSLFKKKILKKENTFTFWGTACSSETIGIGTVLSMGIGISKYISQAH